MQEERGLVVVMARRLTIAAAILTAFLLWLPLGARAATTLTVSSTADDNGSQPCTGGTCPTLRDAVRQANLDSGDTIILPALTPQPYGLTNGELQLNSSMTIQGAGASQVTIDGSASSNRIFDVENSSNVTISGVTLTGGNGEADSSNTGNGGAVFIASGSTLTLTNSTVSKNSTIVNNADGGGIYVDGTLNLEQSAVSGNTAQATDVGDGGGVYVSGSGTASISESTISGNTASGGGGGLFAGAAVTLVNDTITSNSASAQGGGIDQEGAPLNVTNVTIASNSSGDGANLFDDDNFGSIQNTVIAGAQGGGTNCDTSGEFLTSNGNNLEDDSAANSQGVTPSCEFTQPSDQSGVDPKLGPLANNGGPTQTMALQPGSPAIDHGATIASITTDQRGGPRPQPPGGAYDIGAYEASAVIDMGITKSGSPDPVNVGQPLTYTLKATNDGPTTDPGFAVAVTDTLPGGVTFQSASASQGSCSSSSGKVTCNIGTVNEGATVTITIVVIPQTPGAITNTASVASSALDPNPANDSASTTTHVAATGAKPTAVTGKANAIGFTFATVHGSVNPEGSSTTYFFQYGKTASYGHVTATHGAGSGTSSRSVSHSVSGLAPGTVYHYRIVAHNANGTAFGRDRTFRTPQRPSIHVRPSAVVAGSRVTVYGNAGACPVGDTVTLLSPAFSSAHQFAGVNAVSARVGRRGRYSTTTSIPSSRSAGRYLVTGRCGGGNLGVSTHLTVIAPAFTG